MINIDGLTVAEMRAFSASLWKVCETALKTELKLYTDWEQGKVQLPEETVKTLKDSIRQLQLLGIGSNNVLQSK